MYSVFCGSSSYVQDYLSFEQIQKVKGGVLLSTREGHALWIMGHEWTKGMRVVLRMRIWQARVNPMNPDMSGFLSLSEIIIIDGLASDAGELET